MRATAPEEGSAVGRKRREFLHFTSHCTRSFRIERILIFANLAGLREVKSRHFHGRDNHIKALFDGSTFTFAPRAGQAPARAPGRRKNRRMKYARGIRASAAKRPSTSAIYNERQRGVAD